VGFALSLESNVATARVERAAIIASTSARIPMTITANNVAAAPFLSEVPDAAKLVVVGSVLFGLAAAVRRAA
jgi:hypothetical protein